MPNGFYIILSFLDKNILEKRKRNDLKREILLKKLKKACLQWHPDKPNGNELNFMIVSAGMEIVRDFKNLEKYNRMVCCNCDKINGDFEVFDLKKIEINLVDMFCPKCESIVKSEKNHFHSCDTGFWCLKCMKMLGNERKKEKEVRNDFSFNDGNWYSNPENDWYDDEEYLSRFEDHEVHAFDYSDPYGGYDAYDDYDYD
jgi:curved DNA-binding protein CbpA